MKSLRALRTLSTRYSSAGRAAMSSNSTTDRPDVRKLLAGTTSFEREANSERFVSSAYHVDKGTLQRFEKDANAELRNNPLDTSVILFPGQGSQYVGMAKKLLDVPKAKEMFEYASSVMKFNLLQLCCDGPRILLRMTVNCQAAVLVTSLVALEKLKIEKPAAVENCVSTAGFSVGEYAALVFASALTFEEAVQVVKLRGDAMQSCSEARQSGLLVTILNADAKLNYAMKLAREWCQQKEGIEEPVCEVANHLYPHCKVVGGDAKALEFLRRNGRDFGIKRLASLPVSGAFHTTLMKPAKNVVKAALDQVDIKAPAIQVISNVTAKAYSKPELIRDDLIQHVFMPVQWEQTMHRIFKRDQDCQFPNTYEVGPGDTLRPILRCINQKAYAQSFKLEF